MQDHEIIEKIKAGDSHAFKEFFEHYKSLVINYLLEEKEILTPEQQQKFFSIIKERLLHEACNHQTNMVDPVENNDNLNCQKLNKSGRFSRV
ncbi:hypothetical protein ES708_34706 [subsurface metagenome]